MPPIFGASASRWAAIVTSATPEPLEPYLSWTRTVVPECEQKSLQCEDTVRLPSRPAVIEAALMMDGTIFGERKVIFPWSSFCEIVD